MIAYRLKRSGRSQLIFLYTILFTQLRSRLSMGSSQMMSFQEVVNCADVYAENNVHLRLVEIWPRRGVELLLLETIEAVITELRSRRIR